MSEQVPENDSTVVETEVNIGSGNTISVEGGIGLAAVREAVKDEDSEEVEES